jgi:hypothetical protein
MEIPYKIQAIIFIGTNTGAGPERMAGPAVGGCRLNITFLYFLFALVPSNQIIR